MMPYTMQWVVPKRVILTTFQDSVTINDLEQYLDDLKAALEESPATLHQITDSREIEKVEFSLNDAKLIPDIMRIASAMGWTLDVNEHRHHKMLASLISQFTRARYRACDSMDAAIDYLIEIDDDLHDCEWQL